MAARKAKSKRAGTKSAATRRATNKKGAASPSVWLRLAKFGFLAAVLGALGVLGYLVYLDRTITKTFEGRRWSVPAQVYAVVRVVCFLRNRLITQDIYTN